MNKAKAIISFIVAIIVIVAAIIIYNVFVYKVPAGYVGVKVNLLGSSRGVNSVQLDPGRYFIGFNQELYRFPTFTQNVIYKNIQFQTKDGLGSSVDIGVAYSIDKTKASYLFQKYRRGINEITDVYLSNMLRDAFVVEASNVDATVLIDARKDALSKAVEKRVRDQIAQYGVNIEHIFWYGSINLPKEVRERLIQINEARQKTVQRDEEVKQVEAEARKKVAESEGIANAMVTEAEGNKKAAILKAEGEAQANLIVQKSLTSELMIYNIQMKTLNSWNGKLPQFIGGNVPVPFISLNK